MELVRSVLYLPASNPRAIEKARGLTCDAVILDLEDAIAPDAKAEARQAAVSASVSTASTRPGAPTTWPPSTV